MGIWGTLVDWGDTCTAYLPMGSIGKEKGRGERKAQMHFLTLARRSMSKRNEHRMTFVAHVQDAEAVSSRGVADCPGGDNAAMKFHVTVSRRGVNDKIETGTVSLSRDTRCCARLLVDKAAAGAGVSQHWARKVTMHAAYERALVAQSCGGEINETEKQPGQAPVKFLLQTIGSLELGQEALSSVIALLPPTTGDGVLEDQIRSFASSLLHLCHLENLRRSKPIPFTLAMSVGGPTAASKSKKELPSPFVFDIKHLSAALQSIKSTSPPKGCEAATVTIKGNGKFTFTTTASPDLEAQALDYLHSLSSRSQEVWLQSASSSPPIITDGKKQHDVQNDLQPSLNIGIIGDVANGKSTLVKAISGKKTQSHSSEKQQHGITIRLGFANAAVLKCQNEDDICGSFSFLPESQDDGNQASLPNCPKCNYRTKIIKRFSLVDCPGHAELMATMLAGASTFDAVLLTAASNVPCPTPQAKQHLSAIEMSGISAPIAIAQTKAELLADDSKNKLSRLSPNERLKNHASQGRENMSKSVAGAAPIFPICSLLGLGLEAIAEWIGNLPPTPSQQIAPRAPRLTVLRSFDVNRPGQPAEEVCGGVLGGTVQGDGSISLGDVLELRPGLVLPSTSKKAKSSKKSSKTESSPEQFRVKPLRFHCTSLMTGNHKLSSVSRGGLVAVGTTIDPVLVANNRMVGSLAGPVGSLPPVWGPTLLMDNLLFVDVLPESGEKDLKDLSKPSDLAKKACEVRLHIGSATAKGRVVRVSKSRGKIEVHLGSPICAMQGSNVAMEGKRSKGCYCLVAHATLADGDICLEGADVDSTANADDCETKSVVDRLDTPESGECYQRRTADLLDSDEYYRMRFLDDLASREGMQEDTCGSRLSVPLPQITRDGGAHVLVSNFGAIAHSLRREACHVASFLQKEGGLSCVLAGDRSSPVTTTLRVKWRGGRGFAERFVSILKKYIRAYVSCNQCRGAVTELLGASKTEQLCRSCNARRFVAKL